MCGIVGCVAKSEVNQELFDALTVLQHRGQDAAGIVTSDGYRMRWRKGNGLVREVIQERHMLRLRGFMGVGHVRYPTSGTDSDAESQPFMVNSPYGLALVHNGNLINTNELRHDLLTQDLRYLNTQSDSEILLNVLAYELSAASGESFSIDAVFAAVSAVHKRVKGSYAAIAMIQGHGLLAFRDPYAIRPLVLGMRRSRTGSDYMVASESAALDALGYTVVGDVAPGEAIFIDNDRNLQRFQCAEVERYAPCLFEYIYLARPDSIMDGISVHQARLEMGKRLGEFINQDPRASDIDVVIPIPETSRTAALPLAQQIGARYTEGFVKNRYIARTFIMPGLKVRKDSLRLKLNPIDEEFRGRTVLLVDDSIVRGATSRQIVAMARAAGAKKVYFASAAAPIGFPNVYGIDMPNKEELIASGRNSEQVADLIGADWLIYLPLPAVVASVLAGRVKGKDCPQRFEDSVFTGDYITGGIDDVYLQSLRDRER